MRHRTTGMGFYSSSHKIYYHTWIHSFKNYGFICTTGFALEKAFSTTVNGLHIQENITCYKPQPKNSSIIFNETMGCDTFDSFLQSCNNIQLLKQVHALIFTTGVHQNIVFNTKLVDMYGMLGNMENARRVFDKIRERNIYLWNVMIKGYAKNGYFEEAIDFYYQMQGLGTQPDHYTFPAALKACAGLPALQEGREIHNHIIATGFESNVLVGAALINMYCKCGDLDLARNVFDKICKSNVVSWNTMISGYIQSMDFDEALELFNQMQVEGIKPTSITIVSVLSAFAHLGALHPGMRIHAYVFKMGFESDVFVGNSMVAMYAKCGNIEVANRLFDNMPIKDLISWNVMIDGYVQNGKANEARELFKQMHLSNVKPDTITIVSVIQACANLGTLQNALHIHNYVIQSGFEPYLSVGNSLVAMYAKCGSIGTARQVFDKMPERGVVSWNAMIAGYAQNGYAREALKVLYQMKLEGIKANAETAVGALAACAHLGALPQGKSIHNYVIRSGFEADVYVGNSLVAMYAKCGSVEVACQLFRKMYNRDVVSWNSIITGYSQEGRANEALSLFYEMQLAKTIPDSVTVVSVLQSCAHLGSLQQGKVIHGYIIHNGFDSDVSVGNALIAMYANCACIKFARQIFDNMLEMNVVTWNSIISGYAQNGHATEALAFVQQMQLADVTPDSFTMTSVLLAYAYLAALQQGKRIHGYIVKRGFELDVFVGTALVDMYAKCGSVQFARHFFDKMPNRNVVSWNAMIMGYGMHGHGEDALVLFSEMQQMGINPTHITFVCVLSACSHAGLVDEGWQCFDSMTQKYCITPKLEHYACMVDLLGRAGHLEEAEAFIERMPIEPDANVWGALLGACRIHRKIELGERVAGHLFDLEPEDAGYYVLLSNIYAAAGRWDNVEKMRTLMRDRRVNKTPGCSFIEDRSKVHAFVVGDRSHPQSEEIYEMLKTLAGQMKEAGYVPSTDFALYDVEDEAKEHMLGVHSEKLAISFGLINTSPGTTIKITKNLRVCGDCHTASKFISRIVRREIVVRDVNRFHHFKDGLCSCRDYW